LLPADGGSGCKCGGGGPAELVYALGQLGVDFETEARRDSLAQAMGAAAGNRPAGPGNPQDFNQLLAHLNTNPWDAASVTWTLSIDATPVYAIVPAGPYASAIHERLREFLQDMLDGVERISVPGVMTGSVQLANGQIVPAVIPELRGMYSWTTDALVKSLIPAQLEGAEKLSAKERTAMAEDVSAGVRNFLERVYFELRNLGQTSQDRAINFAATNAFNIETVFENAHREHMDLDTIDVEQSPICRPDSDCWDVKLTFFYPDREYQAARRVYRFTVDVSDVVPVTVGPMRTWMIR
jgi:cyanobactin maturation PatA/PatG family protease